MLSSYDLLQQLRHKSELLKDAPDSVIRRFGEAARTISVKAGETVIRKGQLGTSMYLVVDGLLRVHDDDLVEKRLSIGDVFGKMAALTGEPRTTSITAELDTTLIEIPRESLRVVLSIHPEAASWILRMLAEPEKESIISDVMECSWQLHALELDLAIGRQIQMAFLPKYFPEFPGWDVSAYLRSAREVSGDFYDVFTVRSIGRLGLVIGDVCDKGLGAALFMTLFRSLIRATSLFGDFMGCIPGEDRAHKGRRDLYDPEAEAVQNLKNSVALTNNYVSCTHRGTSMFASLFFGLLAADGGSLIYINAGQEAPVIFGPEGIKQRLGTTGPAVGIFPGARFEIGHARLEPHDTLLAFTDGVTDAIGEGGKRYSESRLLSLLGGPSRPVKVLLDDIVSDLRAFTAGTRQSDDITMLAIRHTG